MKYFLIVLFFMSFSAHAQIHLRLAGSGRTDTIHHYDTTTIITRDTTHSNDTIVMASSGGARFNVVAFGADTTGVVDATSSIQAAINAADAEGGGDVYFPNGIYLVSGSIQTSIGGRNPNSILYIPYRAGTSTSRTHLRLIGETRPTAVPTGTTGAATWIPPVKGVIIKNTTATFTSGAAIIGTMNDGAGIYNETELSIENILFTIRNSPAGTGPVISGINYKNGASLVCKFVAVVIDTSIARSTLPQNNVTGIETPDNSSETFNNLENTMVMGFYNGYRIGEHYTLNQVQSMGCYNGVNLKAAYHSGSALRTGLYWCINDIYVSGFHTMANFQLDDESVTSGWYATQYTLKDTANLATGQLYYTLIRGGVGKVNSNFAKSGGTGVYCMSNDNGIATATGTNTFTGTNSYSYNTSGFARVLNTNSHTGGASEFSLSNGTNRLDVGIYGTARAAYNALPSGGTYLYTGAQSMTLYVDATGYINFSTAGSERARITAGGTLAVGTNSPDANSIADFSSTSKFVLLPRMTGAQAEAVGSPADGSIFYCNNGNGSTINSTGIWARVGGAWTKL